MRIVIAASIYPPEVGGPAQYAANLKDAFERQGHAVSVVLYENLKQYPTGVRHLLYAVKIWRRVRKTQADAIIAFDTYSGGLPATLASIFARVPLAVRIGGDFLWEMYIERTKDLLPLPDLYTHRDRWGVKERIIFGVSRFVLRHARAVFSGTWQLNLWKDAYALDPARVYVIENAIEAPLAPVTPAQKNFILYGRRIALKNVESFKQAFAKAQKKYPDIRLEEGMIPHAELMERMRACYAVALPSVSDVTPNYILDAIRFGKPFLLTKHSAYATRFADYGVIVDPLDEDDMARGIERLADDATYASLARKIGMCDERHTYDDIAREFVAVIESPSFSPSR